MKKQNKKLALDKKTIANLSSKEMQKHVGGATRHTCTGTNIGCNSFTCNRHCWSF